MTERQEKLLEIIRAFNAMEIDVDMLESKLCYLLDGRMPEPTTGFHQKLSEHLKKAQVDLKGLEFRNRQIVAHTGIGESEEVQQSHDESENQKQAFRNEWRKWMESSCPKPVFIEHPKLMTQAEQDSFRAQFAASFGNEYKVVFLVGGAKLASGQAFVPKSLKINVGTLELVTTPEGSLFGGKILVDGKPIDLNIKAIDIHVDGEDLPTVKLDILPI